MGRAHPGSVQIIEDRLGLFELFHHVLVKLMAFQRIVHQTNALLCIHTHGLGLPKDACLVGAKERRLRLRETDRL